jgi:hypothetical protein
MRSTHSVTLCPLRWTRLAGHPQIINTPLRFQCALDGVTVRKALQPKDIRLLTAMDRVEVRSSSLLVPAGFA